MKIASEYNLSKERATKAESSLSMVRFAFHFGACMLNYSRYARAVPLQT